MIHLENVSKIFKIPHENKRTLFHRLISVVRRQYYYTTLYALRDVDLEVGQGEFLGIIGQNGSGKTTLLKVLSRVYRASSGKVDVLGDVFPILELNVGFQPEFTCRENVFLYGAILGFSKDEIRSKYGKIVGFAELGDLIDVKLGSLSSGLQARLAFAIASQSNAPIILVDEVLAVGDKDFQKKCEYQFRRFKSDRRTVLFVSHDMRSVEEFCDRVILLDQGMIIKQGPPSEIVSYYLNNHGKGVTAGEVVGERPQ